MNGYGSNGGAIGPTAHEVMGPNRRQGSLSFSEPIETRLDRLIGVLERHPDDRAKYSILLVPLTATQVSGDEVRHQVALGQGNHKARTLLVDNPSGYLLQESVTQRYIPPGVFGYPIPCYPAVDAPRFVVVTGASEACTLVCVATEREYESGASVGDGGPFAGGLQPIGARNAFGSQVTGTAGPAATQLVAARTTRTGLTIYNNDTVANIALGGNLLITFATAFREIPPGGSMTITYYGPVFFIADVGTPVVGYWEEWN